MALPAKFQSIPGMNPKFPSNNNQDAMMNAFKAVLGGIYGLQQQKQQKQKQQSSELMSILPTLAAQGQLQPGGNINFAGQGWNVGNAKPDWLDLQREREYKIATGQEAPGIMEEIDIKNKWVKEYLGMSDDPISQASRMMAAMNNPEQYSNMMEEGLKKGQVYANKRWDEVFGKKTTKATETTDTGIKTPIKYEEAIKKLDPGGKLSEDELIKRLKLLAKQGLLLGFKYNNVTGQIEEE